VNYTCKQSRAEGRVFGSRRGRSARATPTRSQGAQTEPSNASAAASETTRARGKANSSGAIIRSARYRRQKSDRRNPPVTMVRLTNAIDAGAAQAAERSPSLAARAAPSYVMSYPALRILRGVFAERHRRSFETGQVAT
jgi:hypothetical protein